MTRGPASRPGHVAVRAALCLALGTAAIAAAGPLGAQSLEVVASPTRVRVGDPVVVTVRVRLAGGALPLDRAPHPRDTLPTGVRILSADSLAATGEAFTARLRVAFFRPGARSVPALALAYRPAPAAPPDTLVGPALAIDVASTLPAGNQAFRDIKDLEPLVPPRRGRGPGLAAAALALLVGGAGAVAYAARRRRAATATAAAGAAAAAQVAPGAYERALEALRRLEEGRQSARGGGAAREYEVVADVVRRYLDAVGAMPALERTTSELVWSLPPAMAEGGMREACRTLLEEADLVKFARLRAESGRAATVVDDARALLGRWHAGARAAQRAAPRAPDAEAATVAAGPN